MPNSLQFWMDSRKFFRHMLGNWNRRKERAYATDSLRNVTWATRCLTDEIRKVEAQLNREPRYLPKAGFYQGRILRRGSDGLR
jgi:hypothetical protein